MSTTTTEPAVGDLLDDFVSAPRDRLPVAYRRLVEALWHEGTLTEAAPAAAGALSAAARTGPADRRAHLTVLLGLLVEAEQDGDRATGVFTGEVSARLDEFLTGWRRVSPGGPLSVALIYLFAHFPELRRPILETAGGLGLGPDDLSLLERALTRLDPARPQVGRVFPSPRVWRLLDEEERRFDQNQVGTLSPEEIARAWENDTRTVVGHCGAKAYWAALNGTPDQIATPAMPSREALLHGPADLPAEAFARHADALRCPSCGGRFEVSDAEARCTGCGHVHSIRKGLLDLSTTDRGDGEDFLYQLAEVPTMGLFYETFARPAFLRVSGSNWGGAVTVADEDRYIADHVRPVDGPVLDLGAGAGRWTGVLAAAVGTDRVLALDLYPPMLAALRTRVPDVPAIRAGAQSLPFGDGTLGAVLCWNALQAFPEEAGAAIREVGRCLRPGGTFTLLTFRMSDDPVYRWFQAAHHLPGHPRGLRLFDPDHLRRQLAEAGMTIRDDSGPGTFVLITAERTA